MGGPNRGFGAMTNGVCELCQNYWGPWPPVPHIAPHGRGGAIENPIPLEVTTVGRLGSGLRTPLYGREPIIIFFVKIHGK